MSLSHFSIVSYIIFLSDLFPLSDGRLDTSWLSTNIISIGSYIILASRLSKLPSGSKNFLLTIGSTSALDLLFLTLQALSLSLSISLMTLWSLISSSGLFSWIRLLNTSVELLPPNLCHSIAWGSVYPSYTAHTEVRESPQSKTNPVVRPVANKLSIGAFIMQNRSGRTSLMILDVILPRILTSMSKLSMSNSPYLAESTLRKLEYMYLIRSITKFKSSSSFFGSPSELRNILLTWSLPDSSNFSFKKSNISSPTWYYFFSSISADYT